MGPSEIENRFSYHPPIKGLAQVERYAEIRARAKRIAMHLLETIPECREQSLALTKLEEMIFWANAAIARNECLSETGGGE